MRAVRALGEAWSEPCAAVRSALAAQHGKEAKPRSPSLARANVVNSVKLFLPLANNVWKLRIAKLHCFVRRIHRTGFQIASQIFQ